MELHQITGLVLRAMRQRGFFEDTTVNFSEIFSEVSSAVYKSYKDSLHDGSYHNPTGWIIDATHAYLDNREVVLLASGDFRVSYDAVLKHVPQFSPYAPALTLADVKAIIVANVDDISRNTLRLKKRTIKGPSMGDKGYTYVEMLVVVTMIATLTAIGIASQRDLEESDPVGKAQVVAAQLQRDLEARKDLEARLRSLNDGRN